MSRWIYGKHAVLERLKQKDSGLESVCLAKGMKTKDADDITRAAQAAGLRPQWKDRAWLDKQCETDKHQGVAACTGGFEYVELIDISENSPANALVVALDSIEDPHNLGAILRTCECAGAHGVLIPKDRAVQVTPVVEKVSAGAASLLKIASVTNLSRALEDLKKAGFWTYGLAGEAGESLFDQDFKGRVCIVMGAEGKGLRDLVGKNCDKLVKIPMAGKIDSLNVSVAAGVTLFEVLRQRQ